MLVGQGLDSGSTGEPGFSQLDAWAGSDPLPPRSPRLARWRTRFYLSRPLDVLTHIVVPHAGANLLGALAVIPPIILGLALTGGGREPNFTQGRGFLVLWAIALLLGDGTLRWGQPRTCRILRWISPIQGACFLFLPCWVLGIAVLALAAWAAFYSH
jgi:hypothetical protein